MRDPQSEELLKRLQQGDERALSDLTAQYGAKIFQLAFRYLRNHEDAEEVAQDVLFKVYRKVGEFRDELHPEYGWVRHLLKTYWLATELRGDGIYALGRKTGPVRDRYPGWLYS